jgi:hypothetical protein
VSSLAVHKEYFSSQIPSLSLALSSKIVSILQKGGLIDNYGYISFAVFLFIYVFMYLFMYLLVYVFMYFIYLLISELFI